MTEPIMKKVSGDGVKIHLTEWPGQGKTIFCVHGLTANSRGWDLTAAGLSPTYNILAMDLRGRGLSDRPATGYSIDQHVKDIVCILDNLGIDRVTLMGHSLGAMIVLVFAAKHPDRMDKLIIVDGAGKLSAEEMAKVFSGIAPAIERLGKVFPDFEAYKAMLMESPLNNPWSEALEAYFRHEVEDVDNGIASRVQPGHITEEITNLGAVDASEFYGQVKCPTLILRAPEGMLAEDDILLPEQAVVRMVNEIDGALRVDIEGANHYSILFKPSAKRDRAIQDFVG